MRSGEIQSKFRAKFSKRASVLSKHLLSIGFFPFSFRAVERGIVFQKGHLNETEQGCDTSF